MSAWLATIPPALQEVRSWLEAAGDPPGTVEGAADEIGRLRAVLSRIAAARQPGGGEGAFYRGRMDVAVTATAAMPPAGAVGLEAR